MCLPILQASQCNATLQILSFYTKIKLIHICKFTLLYLQRIYFLFKNSPIIVRFPERNGGLYPAAHFCVNRICVYTNNAVPIQHLPKNLIQKQNLKPRRYLPGIFDEKRLDEVFLEWGVLANMSQRQKHEIKRLSRKGPQINQKNVACWTFPHATHSQIKLMKNG